ncbi:hypothetical protein [Tepidibacter aestuarii]|uniref:hypothetical protein n=1 Tax=Tepidibacter aestuarii TaxID=2925782 RepID=UPI0020BE5CFE|nr:hypothetical protein [Tepidibacter aestuarii]CAH2214973.1 conserved protein of unknown function [Tepidibacter aestuarii]
MSRQIKIVINLEVNVNEMENERILSELVENEAAMNEYINNEVITILEDLNENKLKSLGLDRKTKNSHLKEMVDNIDEDKIESIRNNIVTKIKDIEVI